MKDLKRTTTIRIYLLALLLLIGILSTAAMGWFTTGDSVPSLTFQVAKIDSYVTMYRATDSNGNGIPDLTEDGKYDFAYIQGDRESSTDYALSVEPTSIRLRAPEGTDAPVIYPSGRVVYKYELVNMSDTSNIIRFCFEGDPVDSAGNTVNYTDEQAVLLRTMAIHTVMEREDGTVEYVGVTGEEGETVYQHFLADYLDSGQLTFLTGYELAGVLEAGETNANTVCFWTQLEMVPYPDLVSAGVFQNTDAGAPNYLTAEGYNALQGMTLLLPPVRVYFEISYDIA